MLRVLTGILLAGSTAFSSTTPATTVAPYGFVKLDASWDDSRMSTGNYARWVEAEGKKPNDSEFNMTANHTRFGIRLSGPDFGGMKTTGLVEGDFYGGGAENKPVPMMRQAWAAVSWPAWGFEMLAGQTYDLVGPLDPPIIDPNVIRSGGNIGYRHPQVKLTKAWKVGEDGRVDFALGAMRDVVASATWFAGDAGADAGFPEGVFRLGVLVPGWTKGAMSFGVSGGLGQEEWDDPKSGKTRFLRTWAGAVDIIIPVIDGITLRGEGWMGENVATMGAAILQGVNFMRWKEIRARGMWAAVTAGPYKFWKYSLGTGVDRVDESDLSSPTDRKLNQVAFGTVTYDVTPMSSVVLEFYDWITTYKDEKNNAEAFRMTASLIHRF